MKKIIKGKVYDTDTARLLGSDGNYFRSFQEWREQLYQKRTGEFFLYGEGGPASKYAHSIGLNEWSGGWKIIPLTAEKAREWAEEHLTADEYEEIFGVPDEDAEPVALNILLPAPLMSRVRNGAAEAGISLTNYVEKLLTQALLE